MSEQKTLEELRTELWDALVENHGDLAEEALRHFDAHSGFLSALLIEVGGKASFSHQAWGEYRKRLGDLRIHNTTEDTEDGYRVVVQITDREDNPIAAPDDDEDEGLPNKEPDYAY